MKQINAYFSLWLKKSPLCKLFQKVCDRYNIDLNITTHTSLDLFHLSPNMITWGMKVHPDEYKNRKDILYLEHTLLKQISGVWIDHEGWFDKSSICTEKQFDITPTPTEIEKLKDHCRKHFDWDLFSGGDPNGPILYGFQRGRDSTTLYHFKAKAPNAGSEITALKMFYDNCPNKQVIIRPHPRTLNRWKPHRFDKYFRPDWTIDKSDNPYNLLKKCSAFVSINSTLATEALSLGIPVATFGESAFTGSGTTLDCSRKPSRLKWLLEWTPDQRAILRYLCAVMRHHIDYNCSEEDIMGNRSFKIWLNQVTKS